MYVVTAFINVTHPVGITNCNAKQVKITSDFLFGVCFSGSYEKYYCKTAQYNSNYVCPH